MGEGKKLFERMGGGKKLRKDQCLILILAGMLLCVISLPVEKGKSKSVLLDTSESKIEKEQTFEGADDDYVKRWEEKLEDSLRFVEGAGKVRVLIYTGESEEKVLAKDGTEENTDTVETDAAGGNRHVSESRTDKTVVSTIDERGENVPLVVKTKNPCVEGVVVISEGADKEQVRKDIIGAIQVLFDVDMNRISVIKMKTNNQ